MTIIVSFSYILFYAFKDTKQYEDISNIKNAYINLIFKNFVKFLDINYKHRINFGKNLFELMQDIYIYDINYLISKKLYPSI